MKEAIRFEHIFKSFPGVTALSDISFSVNKGECMALLGENGAGKSTLLNILHGIYRANCGNIFLSGKKVDFRTPNEAIDHGISKVHQEINAVKDLTVGQNVTLGREKLKHKFFVDYKTTDNVVDAILQRLDCNFSSRDMVSSLSVGEMQMIAIAKALYNNSTVISFDEPTASLTEKETKSLFSIIQKLKEEGITIIYVSHRLEEIFEICEMATILRDGHFIETVPIKDTSRKQLITSMAGREINTEISKHRFVPQARPPILSVSDFSGINYHNVSFNLSRGEILGFFGLVGAGRTEVMRAIIGADQKQSGSIAMEGKPITISNTRDALHFGIGLLPEDRKTQGFVHLMNCLDNASLSILSQHIRHGFVQRKPLLENYRKKTGELRINPQDPQFMTVNLSGGNQQKVILARWLSTEVRVLIFDEPTKGIDVATKPEIYRIMENLADSGRAIIMVSSELPEIMSVSDRIIVMYEGKITADIKNDGSCNENDILNYAMGEIQK